MNKKVVDKKEKFSIRKFNAGTASVVIGATLFFATGATIPVSADTTSDGVAANVNEGSNRGENPTLVLAAEDEDMYHPGEGTHENEPTPDPTYDKYFDPSDPAFAVNKEENAPITDGEYVRDTTKKEKVLWYPIKDKNDANVTKDLLAKGTTAVADVVYRPYDRYSGFGSTSAFAAYSNVWVERKDNGADPAHEKGQRVWEITYLPDRGWLTVDKDGHLKWEPLPGPILSLAWTKDLRLVSLKMHQFWNGEMTVNNRPDDVFTTDEWGNLNQDELEARLLNAGPDKTTSTIEWVDFLQNDNENHENEIWNELFAQSNRLVAGTFKTAGLGQLVDADTYLEKDPKNYDLKHVESIGSLVDKITHEGGLVKGWFTSDVLNPKSKGQDGGHFSRDDYDKGLLFKLYGHQAGANREYQTIKITLVTEPLNKDYVDVSKQTFSGVLVGATGRYTDHNLSAHMLGWEVDNQAQKYDTNYMTVVEKVEGANPLALPKRTVTVQNDNKNGVNRTLIYDKTEKALSANQSIGHDYTFHISKEKADDSHVTAQDYFDKVNLHIELQDEESANKPRRTRRSVDATENNKEKWAYRVNKTFKNDNEALYTVTYYKVRSDEVDKTKLKPLIDESDQIKNSDPYKFDDKQKDRDDYDKAIVDGKKVYDNPDASQTEVDKAVTDIENAKKKLDGKKPVEQVDKTKLKPLIDESDQIKNSDPYKFDDKQKDRDDYDKAIVDGKKVYDNPDASQTEVDKAITDIENAKKKLDGKKPVAQVDKTKLKPLIDESDQIKNSDPYKFDDSQKDRDDYDKAIVDGKKVYDNPDASQTEVDKAVTDIENAKKKLDGKKPVAQVDKTKLKPLIDEADQIKNSDPYKFDDKQKDRDDYDKAIVDGKKVYDNPDASQTEVDKAVTDIENAKKKLDGKKPVEQVDKTKLKPLIDEADQIKNSDPYKFDDSQKDRDDYDKAIVDGKKVYDNPDASQTEVDKAVTDIENAKKKLDGKKPVEQVDKTKLKPLIDEADQIKNSDPYKFDDSQKDRDDYDKAIVDGKKVYDNPDASQTEVDKAVTDIENAKKKLDGKKPVEQVDKTKLKPLIDESDQIKNSDPYKFDDKQKDRDDYDKAIVDGKKVYDNPDASQTEVDKAVTDIENAKKKLDGKKPVEQVDKTKLKPLIDESDQIKNSDPYKFDDNQKDRDDYDKAIVDGKKVYDNPDTSQTEVDKAVTDIENAKKKLDGKKQTNLVDKGTQTEPNTSDVSTQTDDDLFADLNLDDAKKDAHKKIDKLENLTDDEKTDFHKQIDKATDKPTIDAIVDKATDLDKQRQKDKNKDTDLDKYKEEAKKTIDDLEKISETDKNHFKDLIDKANSKEEVDKIVKDAKDLDAAKKKAKEYINGLNLSDEDKAKFLAELDKARTIDEINNILARAKQLANKHEANAEKDNLPTTAKETTTMAAVLGSLGILSLLGSSKRKKD